MASTDKPEAVSQPETKGASTPVTSPPAHLAAWGVVLRVLVFASAVAAVVVMVTAKQTELVPVLVPGQPTSPVQMVLRQAKFNHSPAFIYFVAALSTAGLYGILTALVSLLVLSKAGCPTRLFILIVIHDVLMLGIVAAATGTAGGVAYIGLKGNSHVGWTKVCNIYDKFCRRIGASVSISLFTSIVLAVIIILSAYSLSKKIPK